MQTLRSVLIASLMLPFNVLAQGSPQPQADRIRGSIDPSRLVALKGNMHPKARPEDDRGPVSPNLSLDYITLHLKPTPAQQADLDQLLADLQNPKSPKYHNWLTPEAYADRFGASPADIAKIAGWLEDRGLTVVSRARGRISSCSKVLLGPWKPRCTSRYTISWSMARCTTPT